MVERIFFPLVDRKDEMAGLPSKLVFDVDLQDHLIVSREKLNGANHCIQG
jgi:hypothetical protein